jgi:hypothetical protein
MRDFHMVSPTAWLKVKEFPDTAKLVFIYLCTSRHQTSAGAFYLPAHYGASDLGWTNRKFAAALLWLEENNIIYCDSKTDEVFILDWFTTNPPRTSNHYKGVMREAGILQSFDIRAKLLLALNKEMEKRGHQKWMDEVQAHLFPTPEEAIERNETDSFY